MQRIAMTPLAGIASGVERGLNAVSTMQDIQRKKQAIVMEDMKIKEAQAKEADLNRVTTKQILFDNLQMGENVRKSVEPFYGMFANPDGTISKKNTFEMMKFLESNPMAKMKMLEGRHADVQAEYNTSKMELEEVKQSGNEKKIQQATQKFNMASQKLSGITQSMTDEKGNRLQLVSKYGAAAEKFLSGEYTPDEFAKAVQEQELAKQQAKYDQEIKKTKEIEKIKTSSKKEIEAIKQANREKNKKTDGKTISTTKRKQGIKELTDFLKTHKDNMNPEDINKTKALISRVQNGELDPDAIIYPDTPVGESGLTHSAKGQALKGNTASNKDPLGIR